MSTATAEFRLFFGIGPLRTGSSLLSRCIDDHPSAICLCESEINRALFRDYCVEHHCNRMRKHGLTLEEAVWLLDQRKQEDIGSFLGWYADAGQRVRALYNKPDAIHLGDKSPDFYRSPRLVEHLAGNYPLIYTVRDPRGILGSIMRQDDASPELKAHRWGCLLDNYAAWKPHLDLPNVLVVRYEDLLLDPAATMRSVYSHIGLPDSPRFQEKFRRDYPERFLWSGTIDWETGVAGDFDVNGTRYWWSTLTDELIGRVYEHADLVEFMGRFGYER